VSSNGINPTFY